MPHPLLALKVDVDTYVGTRDGVPALVAILNRFDIRATFYFTLGPDNSGMAIRRIFTHRGFLRQLLRSGKPRGYTARTLFSGTLLPAPLIGAKLSQVIRNVAVAGHEVGIHGWDHVKWHDLLPWFPKPVTAMELGKASAAFERIFHRRSRTTAAPGWTVSADSLEVQDAMGLDYCSDARGTTPFYPILNGRRFATLQLPTTWPTMDELLERRGIDVNTVNDHLLASLQPGLNVHTIRAELEGMSLRATFINLLERLTAKGVNCITLGEAAAMAKRHSPSESELQIGEIPGCIGNVAIQGETP